MPLVLDEHCQHGVVHRYAGLALEEPVHQRVGLEDALLVDDAVAVVIDAGDADAPGGGRVPLEPQTAVAALERIIGAVDIGAVGVELGGHVHVDPGDIHPELERVVALDPCNVIHELELHLALFTQVQVVAAVDAAGALHAGIVGVGGLRAVGIGVQHSRFVEERRTEDGLEGDRCLEVLLVDAGAHLGGEATQDVDPGAGLVAVGDARGQDLGGGQVDVGAQEEAIAVAERLEVSALAAVLVGARVEADVVLSPALVGGEVERLVLHQGTRQGEAELLALGRVVAQLAVGCSVRELDALVERGVGQVIERGA